MLTHYVRKCAHHWVGHSVWHKLHHLIKVSHSIEAHIGKATIGAIETKATNVHPLHIVLSPLLILTRKLLLLLHLLFAIIRLILTNTTVTSRLRGCSSGGLSTRRLRKVSDKCSMIISHSNFTSIDSCGMSFWASVGKAEWSFFAPASSWAWGSWDTSRESCLTSLLSITVDV